jgi:hypothetical protein
MPSSRCLPVPRTLAGLTLLATTTLMLATAGEASALPANCTQLESTVTCSFVYTGGEQHFTVPTAVSNLQVEAVGGRGGDTSLGSLGYQEGGRGGQAGTASAPASVFAGETLYVEVGGDGLAGNHGGWNGGGSEGVNRLGYEAGAGGGASDVRTVTCGSSCASGGTMGSLNSRLVVAGGGGGGGEVGEGEGINSDFPGGNGGAAEGAGTDGSAAEPGAQAFGGSGGRPGELLEVGWGGGGGISFGGSHDGGTGHAGGLGTGGSGGSAYENDNGAGGGGGGGYLGGGGGGGGAGSSGGCCESAAGGGGGGGSSYAPGGTTGIGSEGDPTSVTISYQVPAVEVTPTPVTFATQAQGTLSAPQTLTIANEGEGVLALSALTFAGEDPGDFLITSSSCMGQVEPGSSCEVTVAFAPQSQGTRAATLQIASNDPGGPAIVSLEGTGGPLTTGATGAPGTAGAEGSAGSTGPAGDSGAMGATGPTGAAGATGATGAAGSDGRNGYTGQLDLMTCHTHTTTADWGHRPHVVRNLVCAKAADSTAFTLRGEARATRVKLMRGRHVYATGMGVLMSRGRARLVLTDPLSPGRCVLVFARRVGGRLVTVRRVVTIV